MQRIIKNGALVDETWHLLPLESTLDSISNSDDLIVPLQLWLDNKHALKARDGQTGVWLQSSEEIETLVDDLADLPLIALDFPVFTDGRHFSSARLLRERFGYQGEVRAIGDVLRDQLFFMQRCGFDAFAVRADCDAEDALLGLQDFSVTYQTSVEQPQPLFRRR